tara:strand:+ start:313 stop:810 length:498 start_codon:yes stop_codon:yes gene_type:complete
MIDFYGFHINIIDLTFSIILIISAFIGYHNGFLKEIVSTLMWLLSLLITFTFLEEFQTIFSNFINNEIILKVVSFFIPFLIIFLLNSIFFKLIFNNLNKSNTFLLNKILGLIFGIFRGILILILCYIGIAYLFKTKENFPEIMSQSSIFEPVKNFSIYVWKFSFL